MAQDRRGRSSVSNPLESNQARDQSAPRLDEDTIRQRAFERYRERGYEDGRDLDDWLEAEREVRGSEGK